jgi:hypothetical protein
VKPTLHVDLETHPFGPGEQAPKPVCVTVAVDRGEPQILLADDADAVLGPWLERAARGEAHIAGAYVAYDMRALLAWRPRLRDRIWDAYQAGSVRCVAVRERLLDIADGKYKETKLDALAKHYLNMELDKSADSYRTKYAGLDGVPVRLWPENAVRYALDDVRSEAGVYYAQDERARGMGYPMSVQADEVCADLALALASAWGMHVSPERSAKLRDKYETEVATLRDSLVRAGLVRIITPERRTLFGEVVPPELKVNDAAVRSRVQASWPKDLELPLTPGGKVSASADTIEDCDDEVLGHYVRYKELDKLLGTFVSALIRAGDLPVHPSYWVLGAESGRVSCSGVPLHQLPRAPGPRECFEPRDGFAYVNCDFSSQEMRTLAEAQLELLGRSKLGERYQRDPDYDPHLEFGAQQFLSVSVEEAARRIEAKDEKASEARQHAKIANFGLPGGMGWRGLIRYARQYGVRWSRAYAEQVIARYMQQWPEMDGFFAYVRSVVGEANYGAFEIYGFRRGACGYTDGSNHQFQHRAARSSKRALWEVTRRCYDPRLLSPLLGSRPWLFFHDEIGVEAPLSRVHEVAVEMERVMVAAMESVCTLVPSRASATVMGRWSKKARKVRGPDGRLIPWMPEAA